MQLSEQPHYYSFPDLLFTAIGTFTFLLDVGTDLWVASRFYLHGDVFWFGLWVGSMAASSVLLQVFSWLWIRYDRDRDHDHEEREREREASACGEDALLGAGKPPARSCALHALQLGFLLRHISALWQGVRVWCGGAQSLETVTYMTHDLSMLRLIETFCESAPQLTLLLYIVLRTNQAGLFQGVSLAASATSIAWMVVDYHRSLRSFLPEKAKQGLGSSAMYFLWNLLLIGARMCCLATFASALPRCFPLHFLLLWLALMLWACLQKTTFMESTGGEWLYRAVVGLVWYFSWFNVVEGRTRCRALIYHSFMAVDNVIIVSTWWCLREAEETQLYAPWLVSALVVSNLLGLLLKLLYYRSFHPTLVLPPAAGEDVPDSQVSFRSSSVQASYLWQRQNKRMAYHASCFYVPECPHLEKRNTSRC